MCPPQYDFYSSPRHSSLGGGLAVVYRNSHKCTHIRTNNYSSFEVLTFKHGGSSPVLFVVVDRPPRLDPTFLSEFPVFLSSLVTNYDRILISGDFNFHVDVISNSTEFLTIMVPSVMCSLSLAEPITVVIHQTKCSHLVWIFPLWLWKTWDFQIICAFSTLLHSIPKP